MRYQSLPNSEEEMWSASGGVVTVSKGTKNGATYAISSHYALFPHTRTHVALGSFSNRLIDSFSHFHGNVLLV